MQTVTPLLSLLLVTAVIIIATVIAFATTVSLSSFSSSVIATNVWKTGQPHRSI